MVVGIVFGQSELGLMGRQGCLALKTCLRSVDKRHRERFSRVSAVEVEVEGPSVQARIVGVDL